MKCDRCDQPAVVHELTVHEGVKSEIHLCQECARQAGIHIGAAPSAVAQMFAQIVVPKAGGARGAPRTCPSCRLTFAEFREGGVLGCPECYASFADPLEGLIERSHAGGTSHVGKCPRRAGATIDRQLRMRRLVKDLEDAVAAEQFERAAQLRDELRNLEADVRPPTGPARAQE